MNKFLFPLMGILSMSSLDLQAQRREAPNPVTYKIDIAQHINSNVYQLAQNPARNELYVVGINGKVSSENGTNVYKDKQYAYILDGKSLAVKDSVELPYNHPGLGLAVNTKTQTLYVGYTFNQAISAINLDTKKQTLIPSGNKESKIREIVVDETNNMVYVSDHGTGALWVVDGKTNTLKTMISKPGSFLLGLQVDPATSRIFTTDGSEPAGNVLVFDSKTHKEIGRWKTWGDNPINIAIDTKGNRLFVAEHRDHKVTVLDAKTGEIITKVVLGKENGPVGLVYDEAKDLVYVALRTKREVAVIDAKNYKLQERIPTEGLPNTIVLNKADGAIYVTNKAPFSRTGEAEVLKNGNTVMKIVKM